MTFTLPLPSSTTLRLAAALCIAFPFLAGPTYGTITWSSGVNTVNADTTFQDTEIVITGGTNTVQGIAGPPAGSFTAGMLRVSPGGSGLHITGSGLTLNSDNATPGKLLVQGNVSTLAASTTAFIASGGSAAHPGNVDLASATRIFNVASGSVPDAAPDLSISAQIINGSLEKQGAGILALSGANTYAGGTRLDAGTLYINSSSALGTQELTIAGSGVTIDNTSGTAINLPSNALILSGGDLTFVGTSNLNFGAGSNVIANVPTRTISVVNATATLTIGGIISDNGGHVSLNKSGAGTLSLTGNCLYTGDTIVSSGILLLSGSASGGVSVLANGTLVENDGSISGDVLVSGFISGTGAIHGSLVVNNGGLANFNTGMMTVDGSVTNNGTFILRGGAQITTGSGFVNNGTLDLTTAGATPDNLTNNGTIITSAVVATKSAAKTGTTVTLTIDSYTGHSYQLQKSETSPDGSAFTINVGTPQQGSTGNVLTFTDPGATAAKSFYRITVDS